jgi:hypothetical protein
VLLKHLPSRPVAGTPQKPKSLPVVTSMAFQEFRRTYGAAAVACFLAAVLTEIC